MSMISEQIEELRLMAEMFVNGEPYGNLLRRAANTIEMLSEKAREPKQGEWIKHDEEQDYCSVCKHLFKTRTLIKQDKWTTYVDDLGYNYCPNCGARMKGCDTE